jgi:hypothetical protein
MIETQAELTADAVRRKTGPGTLVRRLDGAEVLTTSWPWFDGEGDDRSARVMARTDPQDPMTNVEMPYFALVQRTGEASL